MAWQAVIAGIGVAASAIGSLTEANAQRRAARQNAKALREAEKLEKKRLDREIQVFKREAEYELGDTKSSFARAGVDISSGSPLAVLISQRLQSQREAGDIRLMGSQRIAQARQAANDQSRVARDIAATTPLVVGGNLLQGIGNLLPKS